MEYTDGFEYELIQFCEANNILYTRIPGRAKNSLDITRGKNDKVDAARIAQYGEEKHKLLNAYKPLNVAVAKLKELLNFKKEWLEKMQATSPVSRSAATCMEVTKRILS